MMLQPGSHFQSHTVWKIKRKEPASGRGKGIPGYFGNMKLTHMSLFSGIGGLDLAAEWAGIETIGQCEWAEYPTKVLEKHWPDVPRWKDIRTLTGVSFYERTGRRTVDIISGGFPCQPFSVAGKQRGKEDDRYLWPEMVRIIKELRPTWVVGENVAGIVRMALSDILFELEACGYRARTFLIPACAVGARHRRYRVAIVAYTDSGGQLHRQKEINTTETWEQAQCEFEQCHKNVQHANISGCKEQYTIAEPDKEKFIGRRCDEGDVCDTTSERLSDRAGEPVGGQREKEQKSERSMWWATESVLGRVVDGIPTGMDGGLDFLINHYWDEEPDISKIATGIEHRADRLKCLGNAVVPQQFYPIFKAIAKINGTGGQNE